MPQILCVFFSLTVVAIIGRYDHSCYSVIVIVTVIVVQVVVTLVVVTY